MDILNEDIREVIGSQDIDEVVEILNTPRY
jgi:hypothetical protein